MTLAEAVVVEPEAKASAWCRARFALRWLPIMEIDLGPSFNAATNSISVSENTNFFLCNSDWNGIWKFLFDLILLRSGCDFGAFVLLGFA